MTTLESLETTVSRMARIGYCHQARFSPDGARIVFLSNLSGSPQVWMMPTAGGFPAQVTALDDQVIALDWSPDGVWLAIGVAPSGGLNTQLYLVRPDGTDLRRVTDGGRDNNWLGGWADDGRLYFASSRRTPDAMDAWLYDPETGDLHMAAQNQGIGQIEAISYDGRWALLYRMVNRGDSNLWLVDLHTGAETLLTLHDPPGKCISGEFAYHEDGSIKAIWLITDIGRERAALARIAMAKGVPDTAEIIAARDDAELSDWTLAGDGTWAVLIWNKGGLSELERLDMTTAARMAFPPLPAEIITQVRIAADGQIAATAIGANSPQNIWRYDDDWTQVTAAPHAGIALDALVRPEYVEFRAHDDLPLSGWLYVPPNFNAPAAVVLSFHGGPEAQERPTLNAWYQSLLGQGIAVFAPNVRGSTGFGKTYATLDDGAKRFDGVRDIEACARYVLDRGLAQPKRLGIMGGSYGGYMTMAGLTQYPERFAAGVNICGIVNFETFFQHTEGWMAAVSKIEYGDPDTQAELLRALSPIHQIDRVIAPTLVLHGENDTNVPLIEAEQLTAALQARGVPVELMVFPEEGHMILKTPNRVRLTVALTRWFVTHLKG
ncbi:MAG: S9 family peptidase [Chloroflexota bacterium]|nr:S9 family peptidase [Chloroflexota bacterium]